MRCRGALPVPASSGRPRRYCSNACRKAAYRARVSRPRRGARAEWWSPPHLRSRAQEEWDLGLDAAACPRSTLVAENWLGPGHEDPRRRDALTYEHWAELLHVRQSVWLNPPYETAILRSFLQRAVATARAGVQVVGLVPASTGANWWHEFVMDTGGQVEFLRGRLSFGGPHSTGGPAPWSSAIVVWPPADLASRI